MKKTVIALTIIAALMLSLTACGNARTVESEAPASEPQSAASETSEPQSAETETEAQATNTMTAYRSDGSAVILEDCGDGTWKDANGLLYYLGEDGVLRARGAEDLYTEVPSAAETEIGRQDGERFEAVIMLEGMEETVQYEHIRNDSLGFEMDYDYENFIRYTDTDRERLVSVWDDQDHPEDYLEVTYSSEDAETVAEAISAILSNEYDVFRDSRELDRAGDCIWIEASVIKNTNRMAEQLQTVYIIPAPDGCRVATAHYYITEAEGFGRRFSYMMHTLAVIDRNGERTLSDEQALSAIRNYCYTNNPDLENIVNAGEYQVYWELSSSDEHEIVVLFCSYTGAQIRYYINRMTGDTYVTEFVPGLSSEEERTEESFNVREYLG